jgi:hypothetical protein
MESTITAEQQRVLSDFLTRHRLSSRGNSRETSCSIAAVNLALSGKQTIEIPPSMSLAVWWWIINVNDQMPDDMLNSDEWREALVGAAGTGRAHDAERYDLIFEWMWEVVMPRLHPASARGTPEQRISEEAYAVAHRTIWANGAGVDWRSCAPAKLLRALVAVGMAGRGAGDELATEGGAE